MNRSVIATGLGALLCLGMAGWLGSGCGRAEAPKPQPVSRSAPVPPADTIPTNEVSRATPVDSPSNVLSAIVTSQSIVTAPTSTPEVVPPAPTPVSTNAEFQAELDEILDLEQRADFGKATILCTALQGKTLNAVQLDKVRAILLRLRDEKKSALELSFAVDSLGTHKELAERELLKDETVGVLLLRKALREREGAVMLNAASILAAKGDPKAIDLILNRYVTCKDQAAKTDLLGSLEMLKDVLDPALTVRFIDIVAEADSVKSCAPILSILSTFSSTNEATNVVATVYQRAKNGETFRNRYAAAFLGMVRLNYFKTTKPRVKEKDKDKHFGEAVGDPDAATNLTKYMLDLATHRDEKETGFFVRCNKYFPELQPTFENLISIGSWSGVNDINNFTQTATGHLVGIIIGRDPYFYSQDNLNIDLSRYKTIRLTFRNQTAAKRGRFLFTTNEEPGIGEDKTVFYDTKPNDPEFTEYVIDAGSHPKWKGTLKQLRLDIVEDGPKGKFDIAQVVLSDIGSPRK